jgi:hypothetical protein
LILNPKAYVAAAHLAGRIRDRSRRPAAEPGAGQKLSGVAWLPDRLAQVAAVEQSARGPVNLWLPAALSA